MQVVLDANIYVSALISQKGNPFKIIQKWRAGEFEILISQPIIDELLRVTGYERIQKKFPRVKESRLEFVGQIKKSGYLINPSERLDVVTADESDNRYIECAVAGNARYIVSGDLHLLDVGAYRGINIITPATFLTILSSRSN